MHPFRKYGPLIIKMSNEDISMLCDVLLGISNPDKEHHTKAGNKLQRLSNNLGVLTFYLIDIT